MENRRPWRRIFNQSEKTQSENRSGHPQDTEQDRRDYTESSASNLSGHGHPLNLLKNAGSLCSICNGIFSRKYPSNGKDPWRTQRYIHHSTRSSLSASASYGCQICLRLLGAIDPSQSDNFTHGYTPTIISEYSIRVERTGAFSGNMYEIHFYISPAFNPTGPLEYILQPINEVSHRISRRKISEKTLTGSSMELVKEWLHHCKTGHKHCNEETKDCPANWIPSRLIDVGSTDTARLVVTTDSEIYGPYMTLSHKWGHNLEFKLKRDNLKALQEGFCVSLLPRTLADAISVCKLFNVKYIWIDNLCILQDTPEDFEREADSMGKIYGNAVCNISATAAVDGHCGIFAERSVRSLDVCEVKIDWQNRFQERYVILDRSIWKEGVVRAPANRRAWIVQERYLARRILHFGSHQLFWECHELEACETWPRGLPTMVLDDNNGFKSFQYRDRDFWNITDDFMAYRAWNKVLYTYTGSGISFKRDKLIALAGVASRMQWLVGGNYIAGLWSAYLPSELLWRTINWGDYAAHAEEYRAPSWSWASVDVEITRHLPRRNDMKPMCDVLEAKVEPLTDNVFGQIVSGSIVMKAKLYTSEKLKSKNYRHETDETSMLAMDIDPAAIETDCLYFCLVDKARLLTRNNPACRGLVMEPVGSARGTFRRVGYFHVAESCIFELVDTPDIDRESEYPCQIYDELNREHTFTLV